jgi:hypothetical protein
LKTLVDRFSAPKEKQSWKEHLMRFAAMSPLSSNSSPSFRLLPRTELQVAKMGRIFAAYDKTGFPGCALAAIEDLS